MRYWRHLCGGFLVPATGCVATGTAWWATGDDVREIARWARAGHLQDSPWTLDALVGHLAAALLLLALVGMSATFLLSAMAVVLRDRSPRLSARCARITPQSVRRLVAACCGVGLAVPAGSGLPASALTSGRHVIGPARCRSSTWLV